jgi:hypothetical protein
MAAWLNRRLIILLSNRTVTTFKSLSQQLDLRNPIDLPSASTSKLCGRESSIMPRTPLQPSIENLLLHPNQLVSFPAFPSKNSA